MDWKPGWKERQKPLGDEVFLDHVGWFVADLEIAANRLKDLGFRVTRENIHMNRQQDGSSVPSGTFNRLVTPALGYLEFLGSSGDTPLARQHRIQLARYEGLHLMAFAASDVPSEAPRLAESGFQPLEPVDMRRMTLTANGSEAEARFSVLRVPPGIMPEGRVQWCGHFTPDLVWEKGETDQPNGVDALSGALWIVEDLDEASGRFARFVRKPIVKIAEGISGLALERGALLLATASAGLQIVPELDRNISPYGAAVMLRSQDVSKTERALRAGGVMFQKHGDYIVVPPAEALGSSMIIHAANQLPLPL